MARPRKKVGRLKAKGVGHPGKVTIAMARFPGQSQEHPESTDLYVDMVLRAKDDPRVEKYHLWKISDTPITMGRNRAIKEALQVGADILFMLDADMGRLPGEQPFYPIAMDFLIGREVPAIIGAPYCGPMPSCSVYVFHWTNHANIPHTEYPDVHLKMIGREDAAKRSGIEEVAALPTGLVAIDLRCITGFVDPSSGKEVSVPVPWFDYEWTDQYQTEKASTEDVYFTRNASLVGCKCYCAWDSWHAHHKLTEIGRPVPWNPSLVAENYRRVMNEGPERLLFLPST